MFLRKCVLIFLEIEENTAQSMKRLIEVDRIKTRMANTENALQVSYVNFRLSLAS